MTLLLSDTAHPPAHHVQHVAIALAAVRGGTHAGLLFRKNDGVHFLHLAWHCQLRCDPAEDAPQLFWTTPDLTVTQLGALALVATQVAKRRAANDITYGIDRSGCHFEPTTGRFVSGGVGTGLTCASFVWALLRSQALSPLDIDTWRTDEEDAAFEEWVIQQLATQLSDKHAHVVGMRARPSGPRIRPTDIAAAAVSARADWPLAFDAARKTGNRLRQQIGG